MRQKTVTREKQIILLARVVSLVFTPFYLPIVGMLVLFLFSYLNLLPWAYKLMVLILVYFFTILMPTLLIHFYRRTQGWSLVELGARERRMVPYVISILCYLCCVYLMQRLHMPHFMGAIVLGALLVQVVCAVVNVWWKISTHMAAIGGLTGGLFIFGELFSFNPVWWIAGVLVVSGVLGSSRMILRQHTLGQVLGGFAVGMLCAVVGILYY